MKVELYRKIGRAGQGRGGHPIDDVAAVLDVRRAGRDRRRQWHRAAPHIGSDVAAADDGVLSGHNQQGRGAELA